MEEIYSAKNYQAYLKDCLGHASQRTGRKSAAARFIGCHSTFVTHVIQEKAHFSLEQADLLNDFLQHNENESEFFLLLVQRDRAATNRLRSYFDKKLESLRQAHLQVGKFVPPNEALSKEVEGRFFSAWQYSAILVLLTIESLTTVDSIARYLGESIKRVQKILDFLELNGLVTKQKGHYQIGSRHIHLSKQSENVIKHHANWRLFTLNNLDEFDEEALNYSGVVTLSEKDALFVKKVLLEALKKSLETVATTEPEHGYVLCMDFYNMKNEKN